MKLSLTQEGALLLVAFPLTFVLSWHVGRVVAVYASIVPIIAWLFWFFAWASKGGVPPRF